jgi:hypothetical protein
LILSDWQPLALVAVCAVAVILLHLNARLYRFFLKKRGFRFAIQSLIAHWLYFLYSGVAFAIGMARYAINQDRFRKTYSSCIKDGPESAESPVERP